MLDSLCRESSRCPFGKFPLLPGLVFSAAISPDPFAFQSPLSCRPSIRANSRLLPFHANDLGKRGIHSLRARNRANIPASSYGSGGLELMEHAKLANGSGHELPI